MRKNVRQELHFNFVIARNDTKANIAVLMMEKQTQMVSNVVTMRVVKKFCLSDFADRTGISMRKLRTNKKRGLCVSVKKRNRVEAIVRKKDSFS